MKLFYNRSFGAIFSDCIYPHLIAPSFVIKFTGDSNTATLYPNASWTTWTWLLYYKRILYSPLFLYPWPQIWQPCTLIQSPCTRHGWRHLYLKTIQNHNLNASAVGNVQDWLFYNRTGATTALSAKTDVFSYLSQQVTPIWGLTSLICFLSNDGVNMSSQHSYICSVKHFT